LPTSLSAIIQNFKSITSRRVRNAEPPGRDRGPLWQRGYYEHAIRNDKSLEEIHEYIKSNPWNWRLDEYDPDR